MVVTCSCALKVTSNAFSSLITTNINNGQNKRVSRAYVCFSRVRLPAVCTSSMWAKHKRWRSSNSEHSITKVKPFKHDTLLEQNSNSIWQFVRVLELEQKVHERCKYRVCYLSCVSHCRDDRKAKKCCRKSGRILRDRVCSLFLMCGSFPVTYIEY